MGAGSESTSLVGDRRTHRSRRDVDDLVAVHETQAVVVRLHRQAVEEIELGYLQDVLDLPELGAGELRTGVPTSSAMYEMGRPSSMWFVHESVL